MHRDELHPRVRALALEVKDMAVGRDGLEPPEPAPVGLDFMDGFTRFQFGVYLEEEFDVLLVERVNRLSGGSTEDVAGIVADALSERS
ncbi:hypothetical protein ACFWTE_15055 [Nocardiopsis sp. NPDC058631]|uniref:hypothetical protein n=1 Tax=Nocardiopsis sp. NPDC058631 TaxID=3346566 RepID=UPI003654B765